MSATAIAKTGDTQPMASPTSRSGSRVQLGPATQRMRSASSNRMRRASASSQELVQDVIRATIVEEGGATEDKAVASTRKTKRKSVWRMLVRRKSQHQNLKDSQRFLDISSPTNIEHHVHATFDPHRMQFSGLPDEWKQNTSALQQFGVPLANCPKAEVAGYNARIPAVLVALKRELKRNNGLVQEGVFRVSANKDDQNVYKQQINQGSFQGCKSERDAICMASLIKEWFRSLPDPILNTLSRDAMMKVSKSGDRAVLAEVLATLPEPNYSIFNWLLDLLAETAAHEKLNRMSAKALAIVLAPNLYSVAMTASPMELVAMMESAVKVVEQALYARIDQRNAESVNVI